MRVGMVGLATLYWPIAIGNGMQAKGIEYRAAATLGASEAAIAETLGMSASEYSSKYGLTLYERAEEMVTRERLDTVALATRHTQHAMWAERMAQLGVDLFIPKTFATTLADAERIVQAGRRHGVQIAVGPSARFLPPMMAVREAIVQGLIGEPFAVRICHHHGTIDVFGKGDWYRDPQEGGPELSLGWYGIDLVLHLMQDSVQSVFAAYGNYASPDSPFMDCGRIVMRMRRGGVASFDMYFCNRVSYPSWQLEIVGPKGVISIHRVEGRSSGTVVSLDSDEGRQMLPVPEQTRDWETFWIDDLLAGRAPALTAEAAKEITRISLAARDSARTGRPIAL